MIHNYSIQTIITAIVVAVAAIYIVYKIIRTIIRRIKGTENCGSCCCNGCPKRDNCNED